MRKHYTKEHKIVIRNGMSERQTLKTMIHELTHAKLHNEEEMKESMPLSTCPYR